MAKCQITLYVMMLLTLFGIFLVYEMWMVLLRFVSRLSKGKSRLPVFLKYLLNIKLEIAELDNVFNKTGSVPS